MILLEAGGGLGDVINWCFSFDAYAKLEEVPPDEEVLVVLTCGSPFASELFLWHPKSYQFLIINFSFLWPWEYEKVKKLYELPPATPMNMVQQENLKFYPGPFEQGTLEKLKSSPYIVVSTAAGHPSRSMPEKVYKDAIETILNEGFQKYGFKVVIVGRTYTACGNGHYEHTFEPRENMLNLIDQLTVPGTLEAIRGAAGVFCCHSSVCLAAWYLKRPVFLTYPEEGKREIEGPSNPYNLGANYPTTVRVDFNHYERKDMERFLKIAAENIPIP